MASANPVSGPTPAEIRQTMSALQRGWQEGRSQRAASPLPGEPPRPGPPGAGPAASPGSSPGAGQPTADEEARGGA
jgi:hypothetical protein